MYVYFPSKQQAFIELVAALNTGGALYVIMRFLLRKKGLDLEALAARLRYRQGSAASVRGGARQARR